MYGRHLKHKPQVCDVCGSPTVLASDLEIYGRNVSDWDWHILCTNKLCGAHVYTKPGTGLANGKMATPRTKRARMEAHKVFDRLWNTPYQRTKAYEWLAEQLGLSQKECHIKLFDTATCYKVIRLVRELKPVIPTKEESCIEK